MTAAFRFGLLAGVDEALPLVGRRTELASLTNVLSPGSGPRAVVLVGEAGVGKTRLVTEAARRARAAGVTVLMGGCLPLTDSVPFLPVIEALRGLSSSSGKPVQPAVLERCEPHVRSELVRLIPAWGAGAPSGDGPVEGWQRGRLFSALRDLLATLADERPCALVVEDLHWADATTLDFLAYLAAVDRDGITPLVLTSREEEIGPKRPVGRWLAELARQAAVAQLPLGRLSRPEVAEQIHGLVSAAVPSFVDDVFARAEGNAFFTEQLVAASVGGAAAPTPGAPLPATLTQLLLAQAEAVGEDSSEVLTALAVAGRELNETLLTSITSLAGTRLSVAVRELADVRLIDRPGIQDRYRLRHALVGEAVAAGMLAGDRRERHAIVARALIANAAAEGSGEVAEHWAAAGEITEEMPWRLAAAREAEQVYAYQEAADHWQRLIQLWPQVPAGARPARLDLATAYLNTMGALERCGDTRRAGRVAEEALRTLASTVDRRTLAGLYERAAGYRECDQDGAGLEPLEAAMELLADLPPGREHALVFWTYGVVLWKVNRDREARAHLERALQACRSGVPTLDEVEILCELAYQVFDEGDIDAGMRWLDQAAALAGRDEDRLATVCVTTVRSEALLVLGRLEEAAAVARAGLETARRAGLEQQLYAQQLRCRVFRAAVERGRISEADAAIRATTDSPPTSGGSYDHMMRATLDMLAGDLAATAARWAAIEVVTHPSNLQYGGNLVDRGVIDLWSRRPTEALSRIKQVPQPLDAADYRRFTAALLTTALRACADLADTARARRDAAGEQAARNSAQDLAELHGAMERDPFAPHPFHATGPAEGATWAAELTRVAGTSDPDAWAAAAAAWTRLDRPHRIADARWRQAEALLTAGRGSEARDCVREAAAAAQGHVPLLDAIRDLARLARIDLHDQLPEGQGTGPPAAVAYGLTPREATVLRLVAAGLTNSQIGNRLFISEKTASVHVTNILRKLGVHNRAHAAALAQRAGLLQPDPS